MSAPAARDDDSNSSSRTPPPSGFERGAPGADQANLSAAGDRRIGHVCHSDCSEYSDQEDTRALIRKKVDKMEARNEHQRHKQFSKLYRANTLVGIFLFALVLVWCTHYRGGFAWHSDYNLQFNWHPLLMTFGMLLVYSISMLVYRSNRNWVKRTLKLNHAGLHLVAFVSAVIGLKAVFDFHNYSDPPKPNLYSLHSWMGLTAVIMFSSQYVFGFVTFLWPGLAQDIRKFSLPVHVVVGTTCFLFCVIAAFTGLTEKALWTLGDKYGELPGEAILVNVIGIMLALFAALTLYLVTNPDYKRVSDGDEQIAITEHTE